METTQDASSLEQNTSTLLTHKQLLTVSHICFLYVCTPAQFSRGASGFTSPLSPTNLLFGGGEGDGGGSEIVYKSEVGYVTRLNL